MTDDSMFNTGVVTGEDVIVLSYSLTMEIYDPQDMKPVRARWTLVLANICLQECLQLDRFR